MHYIYQLRNSKDQIIYVGITGNITKRLNSGHFGGNGHLPDEAYAEAAYALYSECVSKEDADLKERYLINTLAPKYNQRHNNGAAFGFKLPEPEWVYIAINKTKLISKPESKTTKIALQETPLSDPKLKIYKSIERGGINKYKLMGMPHFHDVPCKLASEKDDFRLGLWKPRLTFIRANGEVMVCADQIVRLSKDSYSVLGGREFSVVTAKRFINESLGAESDIIFVDEQIAVEHCLNTRTDKLMYIVWDGKGCIYEGSGYSTSSNKEATKILNRKCDCGCGAEGNRRLQVEKVEDVSKVAHCTFMNVHTALKFIDYFVERVKERDRQYSRAVKSIKLNGCAKIQDKNGALAQLYSLGDLENHFAMDAGTIGVVMRRRVSLIQLIENTANALN